MDEDTIVIPPEDVEVIDGFEYKEENADDSNSFFLLGEQDATVLKYSFEENSVLFVFSDNSLTAVAVYSTENWNV